MSSMADQSIARLLFSRRFGHYFLVLFGGAFNDNLYKSALLIIVALEFSDNPQQMGALTNMAAALFIVPYFLFSGLAGYWADSRSRSAICIKVKLLECIIVFFGGLMLYLDSVAGLLFILFLLGTQSAFFSPVKYSIVPNLVGTSATKSEAESLTKGNSLMEGGTFSAILIGTITGGLVMTSSQYKLWLGGLLILVALIGLLNSLLMPKIARMKADTGWGSFRFIEQNRAMLRWLIEDPIRAKLIAANAWFWFLGSIYLVQLPNLVLYQLGGQTSLISLLLAVFTLSVVFGSWVAARLSTTYSLTASSIIRYSLLLLSLGGLCLGITLHWTQPPVSLPQLGLVLFCISIIGSSGGSYVVPVYTLIQQYAPREQLAQTFALGNIINSVLMIGGSLLAALCLGLLAMSMSEFLFLLTLLNLIFWRYLQSHQYMFQVG